MVRVRAGNGSWEVLSVADLNEAAALLNTGDNIVLGLPVNAVIAQRLRLPTVDPSEFEGMVRLQVEKAFPYPPEEVTSDFEVIEKPRMRASSPRLRSTTRALTNWPVRS